MASGDSTSRLIIIKAQFISAN
uniref:Uncharacterized protein n=1 Tax=Anguilla anguilla TaxID=7936 RepID=A0A0E9RX79_ANGAN